VFEKVNKATASEIIVEQILENLASGKLKPGDKLPPEREMAEIFGVCRASVREATRALTLMGHLEVHQGKGAFLKETLPGEAYSQRLNDALAAVEALDLMEMRDVLECKALELAAQRASSSQLAEIGRAVVKMEAAKDKESEFYVADMDFHMAVAEASNNQVLIQMMSLIKEQMLKDRDAFLGYPRESRDQSLRLVKEVYKALRAGDVQTAVQEMTLHLNIVTSEVHDLIKP
jgi:GntR family transcriptional repressor for pyruvate dehydrogenase complex